MLLALKLRIPGHDHRILGATCPSFGHRHDLAIRRTPNEQTVVGLVAHLVAFRSSLTVLDFHPLFLPSRIDPL